MELDHVAIHCSDIAESAQHYVSHYGATILYQDSTWAFLRIGQGKLALVTASQHPPHIALRVSSEDLTKAASEAGISIDTHRDGTQGIYVSDLDGNQVELIHYPEANHYTDSPVLPGGGVDNIDP